MCHYNADVNNSIIMCIIIFFFIILLISLQEDFVGPSFETISSSGPNSGIIHYSPTPETDRKLSVDEMYLCDSGGQFL